MPTVMICFQVRMIGTLRYVYSFIYTCHVTYMTSSALYKSKFYLPDNY